MRSPFLMFDWLVADNRGLVGYGHTYPHFT